MKNRLATVLIGSLFLGCGWLNHRLQPNVEITGDEKVYVYLPTNANIETLIKSISDCNCLIDEESFKKSVMERNLDKKYKPGKYEIKNGMSNRDLVKLFKSGKQTPVRITFNSVRTLNHLAGKISGKLEVDSSALMKFWNNKSRIMELYKLELEELPSMFIPNTYEFYWNTDAEEFTNRMQKEYKKFWTDKRKSKAEKLGLTPTQVITLASIVQSEQTRHKDEWPIIARLYMNRLKKRMLLQADPTVIFALGDFSITRVLKRHLEVNSPYNTYKHIGLPPGPIMIPEGACIDAVLDAPEHDYIFMCAKEDLNGKHNFTASLDEHNRNAKRYQIALRKWQRENR